MISRSQFDLEDNIDSLHLVEQILNLEQRVLVLNGDLIQRTVIHTHLLGPSFFPMNRTGAPHGDELGWINLLACNLAICFFNSTSSFIGILYGLFQIDGVLDNNSMMNSMSQWGGIPNNSSRKTSGSSRIICDIPSFHCSHFLVIYSGSSCKLPRILNNGTWLKFEFKLKPSLFYSQNKSRRTCMETLILPCNHANLNSYSGRARQTRILGNLSDF
jgi:hypothetical protein